MRSRTVCPFALILGLVTVLGLVPRLLAVKDNGVACPDRVLTVPS